MKKWGIALILCTSCIAICAACIAVYQFFEYKDLDSENSNLKLMNIELKSDNQMLQSSVEDSENLADSLEDSITLLEKKIKELTDESVNYKNEIDNLNGCIASLEKTVDELENKESNVIYVQPPDAQIEPSFSYQTLYSDMYVETVLEYESTNDKVVYITFDDGPSQRTEEILKILEEKNIKATFFVVPDSSVKCAERLRAIAEAGHTIGIHTSSHVYNTIYASVDNFLKDFYKAWDLVYKATGIKCDIFRFPGGSINSYNRSIYQQLIAEMTRRGFVYYDWNTSGDDSAGQKTSEGIYNMTVQTAGGQKKVVLLLHDNSTKVATVEALPKIIEYFSEKGYRFDALSQNVKPVVYGYKSN